jgi:poly(hydroxyalkanoate) granule-associated protein
MATKEKVKNEETNNKPFLETTKKIVLASIGAVALAQDEIENFINRLVERGEIAEKDGRKLMDEFKDKRKKKTKETEGEVENRLEGMLEKMGVPTKADIEALSKKITELSEKVDQLNQKTE